MKFQNVGHFLKSCEHLELSSAAFDGKKPFNLTDNTVDTFDASFI